jgi:hypothetical protein
MLRVNGLSLDPLSLALLLIGMEVPLLCWSKCTKTTVLVEVYQNDALDLSLGQHSKMLYQNFACS